MQQLTREALIELILNVAHLKFGHFTKYRKYIFTFFALQEQLNLELQNIRADKPIPEKACQFGANTLFTFPVILSLDAMTPRFAMKIPARDCC